jgi:hypothetical protein
MQELAGHRDLSTPQKHMNFSPAMIESAIRLLEQCSAAPKSGDILETGLCVSKEAPNDRRIAGRRTRELSLAP